MDGNEKNTEEKNSEFQQAIDELIQRNRGQEEEPPVEPVEQKEEEELEEEEAVEQEEEEPEQGEQENSEEPEEPEEPAIDLESEVRQLRETIARLTAGKEEKSEKEEEPKKAETEGREEREEMLEALDLSDDEFDEAMSSRAKFLEVLRRVQKAATLDAEEKVLRRIPDLVSKTYQRQSATQSAVTNFYAENPDLKSHTKYVGFVFNELQSESPDASVESLLKKTEERVRKDLALSKQAEQTEKRRAATKSKKNQPAFAQGGRTGAPPQDTRTIQQKQIDEILI